MIGMPVCKEGTPTDECALQTALSYAEATPHSVLCPICILGRIGRGVIPVHRAIEVGRKEGQMALCDEGPLEPKYEKAILERSGSIFQSTDGRFYTFAETAITCPACIEKRPTA